MALEPLSGKSNMVTEKIDVYSFGIVMWELLTGDKPYADMHCASIIGNKGHEYVLRRILCRDVRYGTEVLKAQLGFFNGLVKVVVQVMGNIFPELRHHEVHIRDTIAAAETTFGKTLLKVS
ncbi:hypothetical protein CsSME_00045858 [Camellia sinensis var. sinensis]